MRETDRSNQLSKHTPAKAVVFCLIYFCLNIVNAQVEESSFQQSADYKVTDEDGNVLDSEHYEDGGHQGFVGCLFSDVVCNEDEICFDDLAFGRCISNQENGNNDILYRYDSITPEDKLLLELEMDRLSSLGYHWSDDYAQCVFQTVLNTIRFDLDIDTSLCEVLREDPTVERGLIDPSQVTPESMIPPNLSGEDLPVQSPSLDDDELDGEDAAPYSPEAADFALQPAVKRSEKEQAPGWFYGEFDDAETPAEDSSDEDFMTPDEKIEMANYLNMREALNAQSPYAPLANTYVDDDNIVYVPADYEDDIPYKRKREEEEEEMLGGDPSPFLYRERARDPEYEDQDLSPYYADYSDYSADPVYEYPEEVEESDDDVGSSLASKIFNRNERLDVKKPGPFFPNSANNFFLNKLLGNSAEYDEANDTVKKDQGQVEYEMPLLAPVKDKRDLPIEYIEDITPETSYVHIGLKNRLDTLRQGEALIEAIANSVGIPNHAFSDRKIETNHVQFQVDSNPQDMDAHTIAKKLDEDADLQKRLTDSIGVEIAKAAAGDRDDPNGPSLVLPTGSGLNLLILVVTVASTCAALLVVVLIMCLVRRKARNGKLLRQEELEQEKGKAQSEYKQLCRDWSRSSKPVDRQSSKGSTTSASNPATKQLQSRDSKDSDRSSTSSWTEEPNSTNMDISTGHMVLAYMEDHLKNKQRLEQEWVGLCGYEAEPCATTVAFKTENKKKNRYPDKLPYDHNRVILNALLNATNSDYINGSTVTDHDPRNPSYIVSQGPMAQTVADFWQMVWEQGCVVIVMLTRLQDNGNQLCHRYWPEEGSEQYHIFEVHLVSEHVWCDDYLVRSVYLKNTRTGETRTVTQFHFRSWPCAGTPSSTKALLEFRRKVNKSYRGRSCPIVVHCSDGVGRSGTYVLIDMVLNRMAKGCKEIDIAATLEHIRDQRGGMVQTRQQFEFCLMAVAEEVHAILKAMPQ